MSDIIEELAEEIHAIYQHKNTQSSLCQVRNLLAQAWPNETITLGDSLTAANERIKELEAQIAALREALVSYRKASTSLRAWQKRSTIAGIDKQAEKALAITAPADAISSKLPEVDLLVLAEKTSSLVFRAYNTTGNMKTSHEQVVGVILSALLKARGGV